MSNHYYLGEMINTVKDEFYKMITVKVVIYAWEKFTLVMQ